MLAYENGLNRSSKMPTRRRTERLKSFLRGRVNFDNGRISLDCLIRDITNLGARIIFSDTVNIPSVVNLHIPQKAQTLRAHVIWRHGDEIGLAFTEANPALAPSNNDHLAARVTQLESEIIALRRLLKKLVSKMGDHSDAA